MLQLKYFAYLAVVCAVLLDLCSANPDTSAGMRLGLNGAALVFALIGFGGLALAGARARRRS